MVDSKIYDLYRYQLVPISQQHFLDRSVDDLINAKNDIFASIINNNFKDPALAPNSKYIIKLISSSGDIFHLSVVRKSQVRIINEDGIEGFIPTYPRANIIINNNKESQILAVERTSDFQSTNFIANLIKNKIKKDLFKENLYILISPITRQNSFWDFIDTYSDVITEITFIINTPNMSNISSSLDEDIKSMAKTTNAIRSTYKIKSASESNLDVNRENSQISGLVEYIAQGGGRLKAKAKKVKINYDSNRDVESVEIDNPDLETGMPLLERILGGKIA